HHEATTESGIQVDVYSLPDARIWKADTEEWIDGGEYAAKITAESTDLYAEKFGPYLHNRIVIVQGDFPDGMEFSGFGFVSTDWFVSYEGSPQSYLMLITVHEVAHQWWYDLVGNDQAQSPWLDEALATYSEYIYIEAYYPEIADWWWFFRVNRLNPEGFVNSSVYEFTAIRPYINAVYLRGVMMLHDMRTTLGDDGFYLWLRDYADANAGNIATADSLWEQLTPEQFAATAVIRTAFLRQSGG
ncbi:MAG: M1 family aminopeptidase, partial [Chloroflexota bacterium]